MSSNGCAAYKSSWVPQLPAQESCNGLLERSTSLGVSDPISVQSSCMIIEYIEFWWLDRRLNHDAILTIVNVVIQKSNLTVEFPPRAEDGFEASARGLSICYICFDTAPDTACSNTRLHMYRRMIIRGFGFRRIMSWYFICKGKSRICSSICRLPMEVYMLLYICTYMHT